MVDICFYFQVHQPKRLRKYTYFDIGNNHFYEDDAANRQIFLKVANKCYLPATATLLQLIEKHQGGLQVAFSLSGVFIEQCRRYSPETLAAFKRLAATNCVEFLNETYYHSLAYLFDRDEFMQQVKLHRQMVKDEFGFLATTFRNTELIYSNDLAKTVEELGYTTILAEGAAQVLAWRSPNHLYRPKSCKDLKVLLRNYRLTDDIGFRFSEKTWSEYPLHSEKYAAWLHALHGQAEIVNLFMDFETFGEHHWREAGIFAFLEHLPTQIMKHPDYKFVTPSQASSRHQPVGVIDSADYYSWADEDRGLSAWRGNNLQEDALQSIYELAAVVKQTKNPELINTWRSLLTSDHFYYMCTKYENDGDVHKYFNPYHHPYEAYINYLNVVTDLRLQLQSTAASSKLTLLEKLRRLIKNGSRLRTSK